MNQHTGSRLLDQNQLHHFTRVNAGAVNGAAEQLDVLDDPMMAIDQDEAEHLIVQVPEPHREKFADPVLASKYGSQEMGEKPLKASGWAKLYETLRTYVGK